MYTLRLSHTAMTRDITFSFTAVKNDIPQHWFAAAHLLSFLSSLNQTGGPVFGRHVQKEGDCMIIKLWLKLAASHREMCTLKSALPVRHKRRNAEKDWKSGGDHSQQGCGCEFSHRTV